MTQPKMAPPKTPRSKSHSDAYTPHNMAPTSGRPADNVQAAQPSEALAQAQEDEREVLKAIFMGDYQEAEAKGSWGVRTRLL
jgi:translation initiation factor 2-alpha kinase 4